MKLFVTIASTFLGFSVYAQNLINPCSQEHSGVFTSQVFACRSVSKKSIFSEVDQCANGDWGSLIMKTSAGRWISEENASSFNGSHCSDAKTICTENYALDLASGILYRADGADVSVVGLYKCKSVN